MKPLPGLGFRRAIKRADAERLLLLMLLSFAGSVVVTRIYLQLTGYPQIGGGELHIAHMLWGGLLLFIGGMLMLILANRWMLPTGAILTGIGVGLFIDEVGKFITKSNDYFYPLAAPIIYAFFLLTVWLYLQVRRPTQRDVRSELSQALEYLGEVVDDDMDVRERAEIDERLQRVASRATSPDQIHLATTLLQFIRRDELRLVKHPPSRRDRFIQQSQRFEVTYISRRTAKAVIVIGLVAFGVLAIQDLLPIIRALLSPNFASDLGLAIANAGLVRNTTGLLWYLARQLLEGLVGLSLIGGAGLLLTNREEAGLKTGYIALVLNLLTVNLLVLYFDQFTTIVMTILQFSLLLALMRFRRRYFTPSLMRHQ
jgi:hypothetical protein